MADDPYKILGVARDATPEAIKKAYRALARKHHPDLNPDKPEAEARFKAASTANELLSDPEKRARFDRGEINADGQEQAPAGGGFGGGFTGGSPGSYRRHAEADQGERYSQNIDPEMYDDLLADLFQAHGRRAGRRPPGPRPGADEHYRLDVPFHDAVLGATVPLTLPDGRTLSVKIPPGVVTGQVLRLRGQGGPGRQGGPAGDAMIELAVADHALFRRDGFDLHLDLPVTLKEAVLGGPVQVPTPAGPLRVTLPAASDTGRVIRLRGRGVAAHASRPAGDLLLTLRVVIGQPDAALEAFLRDWTPEAPLDPRAGMEAAA